MDLMPPPILNGNPEIDRDKISKWMNDIYEFLKYPHFDQIRIVKRTDPSESIEGVIYLDDDDDILKCHNGTAFQDCY